MKRLSEHPKARALAWVVCVVGLALCLVCGQQAAWVAQRGGYQPNGYTTVVENEVNQVLQDYTQTIAQEYTLALSLIHIWLRNSGRKERLSSWSTWSRASWEISPFSSMPSSRCV